MIACPFCGGELDVINNTPRALVCQCLRCDRALAVENFEYHDRILGGHLAKEAKMVKLKVVEVKPHPALVAIEEYHFAMMMRAARELEVRCAIFMARTGLPVAEIVLVQLRNGHRYPQWRGAVKT